MTKSAHTIPVLLFSNVYISWYVEGEGTFDWFSLLDSLSNGTPGNTLVLEKSPSLLLIGFPCLTHLSNGTPGNTLVLEKSPSVLWRSLVVCLTSLFKRYTKKHPGIGEITIIAFDCFSCLTQSLVVLRNDVKQQRNPQIHNQKAHPGHQNLLLHTTFWKPSLCLCCHLSLFF